MITIRFACGHHFTVQPSAETAPTCPTCGEHRISRTTAPAPRFVGACAGPSAESRVLEGVPIAIPKESA